VELFLSGYIDQIEHVLERMRVLPHVAALMFAYVLAFPIGWDRERNERSAGLRTFPLVAVAACGFVQATETIAGTSPEAQARIIEGLITGIGFIGGGAIIKQGGAVQGTATAAGLWATGAIGAAVGLGSHDVAIVIALFTIATFRPVSAQRASNSRRRHRTSKTGRLIRAGTSDHTRGFPRRDATQGKDTCADSH
jgi:putative Mg2+ transporter-C (MgtC) family protein